jgi:dTDP-4-amino-4,6-dideoxygalactose transaminase
VIDLLNAAGISTGIHYPGPLHLQSAYSSLRYKPGDFSIAEKVAGQILSLPMFPQLTAEQQIRVSDEMQNALLSRWGISLCPALHVT